MPAHAGSQAVGYGIDRAASAREVIRSTPTFESSVGLEIPQPLDRVIAYLDRHGRTTREYDLCGAGDPYLLTATDVNDHAAPWSRSATS